MTEHFSFGDQAVGSLQVHRGSVAPASRGKTPAGKEPASGFCFEITPSPSWGAHAAGAERKARRCGVATGALSGRSVWTPAGVRSSQIQRVGHLLKLLRQKCDDKSLGSLLMTLFRSRWCNSFRLIVVQSLSIRLQ